MIIINALSLIYNKYKPIKIIYIILYTIYTLN